MSYGKGDNPSVFADFVPGNPISHTDFLEPDRCRPT
jgi:hypothetical protein